MQAHVANGNGGQITTAAAAAKAVAAPQEQAIPQPPRKSPKLKYDEFSIIQKACVLFDNAADQKTCDRVLNYLNDKYAVTLHGNAARRAFLNQLGEE